MVARMASKPPQSVTRAIRRGGDHGRRPSQEIERQATAAEQNHANEPGEQASRRREGMGSGTERQGGPADPGPGGDAPGDRCDDRAGGQEQEEGRHRVVADQWEVVRGRDDGDRDDGRGGAPPDRGCDGAPRHVRHEQAEQHEVQPRCEDDAVRADGVHPHPDERDRGPGPHHLQVHLVDEGPVAVGQPHGERHDVRTVAVVEAELHPDQGPHDDQRGEERETAGPAPRSPPGPRDRGRRGTGQGVGRAGSATDVGPLSAVPDRSATVHHTWLWPDRQFCETQGRRRHPRRGTGAGDLTT